MSGTMATCQKGHKFILKDFDPFDLDDKQVAAISWCPELVQNGLLWTECGALVLWIRWGLDKFRKQRKFIFRKHKTDQLDLFEGLDK